MKKNAGFTTILLCLALALSGCKVSSESKKFEGNTSYVSSSLSADKVSEIDIPEEYKAEIAQAYEGFSQDGKLLGYTVFSTVRGYNGDIFVGTSFDPDLSEIVSVYIDPKEETKNLGSKIGDSKFLEQFAGKELPLALRGFEETVVGASEGGDLKDGVYRAENKDFSDGFKDFVEITVENGKLEKVNWDSVNEEGRSKKELSKNGEYVMTENGPLWYEQANLMEELLIRLEDPAKISLSEDGKTDAVASASITVSNFVKLADECLKEARGEEIKEASPMDEKNLADSVSGATVSSKAAIKAINLSFDFLKNYTGGL